MVKEDYDKIHDLKETLRQIIEISYIGHPDGQGTRLEIITRMAKEALKRVGDK